MKKIVKEVFKKVFRLRPSFGVNNEPPVLNFLICTADGNQEVADSYYLHYEFPENFEGEEEEDGFWNQYVSSISLFDPNGQDLGYIDMKEQVEITKGDNTMVFDDGSTITIWRLEPAFSFER